MNKKMIVFSMLTFAFFIIFGLSGCKKKKPDETPKQPEVKITPETPEVPETAAPKTTPVEPEQTPAKTADPKPQDPDAVKKMLNEATNGNNELAEIVAKMLAEAQKNNPVQTTCPVMEGKIKPDIFVEYKGKKVYFCSPECKEKFNADPEKYLPKLPQFKN